MLEINPAQPDADYDAQLRELEQSYQRFQRQRESEPSFWQVAVFSMAAGAGLFVAGAVLAKLYLG
jgi:hypothetical protein